MTDQHLTSEEERRLRAAFAGIPFVRLLGMELGEVKRGAVTVYLDVREELRQVRGLLHGGVTASLMDTAAAFAIITTLSEGESTATVDLTVHYLRPLLAGRLTAHARVLRAGRRLATISVEVLDEAGNLAATALTTYAKLA